MGHYQKNSQNQQQSKKADEKSQDGALSKMAQN